MSCFCVTQAESTAFTLTMNTVRAQMGVCLMNYGILHARKKGGYKKRKKEGREGKREVQIGV